MGCSMSRLGMTDFMKLTQAIRHLADRLLNKQPSAEVMVSRDDLQTVIKTLMEMDIQILNKGR